MPDKETAGNTKTIKKITKIKKVQKAAPEKEAVKEAAEIREETVPEEKKAELKGVKKKKEVRGGALSFKVLDKTLMVVSILITTVLILLLVLNAPIIAYTSTVNGVSEKKNVSVLAYYKAWKPLVELEGTLEKPDEEKVDAIKHTEAASEAETVTEPDDGLDLDQIIENQYTILFLGFDEDGTRSDVNWIFQIDIKHQTMNVMQIPRDTFVPDFTGASTNKFNSVYSFGDETVSPIQRVVNAVQDNYGFVVDAYVTLCCSDIPNIVDSIGGIPITVPERIVYEADKIIPAGEQVLDGKKSEWFVRFRHGYSNGDIGRVQAQRIFMAAAFKKATTMTQVTRYSALKKIYDNNWVATNLSLDDIGRLGDFMSVMSMDKVNVYMLPGEGAMYGDQSIWSTHKRAALDLINKNFRPYQNDIDYDTNPIVEAIGEEYYMSTEYDDQEASLNDVSKDAEERAASRKKKK